MKNKIIAIEKIAEKLGLNLINDYENCEGNECFIVGRDVYCGKFENKEYKLISIFHEYGHTKIAQKFIKEWRYNTLIIEIQCWWIGIKKAKSMGIFFSDDAINFAIEKVKTYVGYDAREYRNIKK